MTPEELEIERAKLALEQARLAEDKRQNRRLFAQFVIGGVALSLIGLIVSWDKSVRDDKARERALLVEEFGKIYTEPDAALRVAMLERLDRATGSNVRTVKEELRLSREDLRRQEKIETEKRAAEERVRLAKQEQERIDAEKRVVDAERRQALEKQAADRRLADAIRKLGIGR